MKYLAIGEICELLNGFAFKSKEYTNEGIRIIRIANVQKGYIEDSAPCYYPEVQLPTFKKSMLSTGDLLISLTGNVGRVGLLPESMIPAALNQRVGCLRVKNDHEMDIKYLFHLLNSDYFENACIESSNGAAQKNLSTNWLKEFLIPIPSLVEQKAIARVFEYIVLLLELEKRRVDYFDDLVKSRFIEMFGDPISSNIWPMKQLEELYSVGSSKRIYTKDQTKEGVPFYRLADVGCLADGLNPSNDLFISEGRFAELKKAGYVPGVNDILVTARGTLGKCYIVRKGDKFYFQDGMITWLRQTETSPQSGYLVALFSNDHFLKSLNDLCSGTTVKYLSISDLAKMRIPIPPSDLQDAFLFFAAQVDKLKFDFDFLVSFKIPSICLLCLELDP